MATSTVTQAIMMSRGMVSFGEFPEELLQGRGVGLLPLFQEVPEPAAFGQGIEGAEDRYGFIIEGFGEGAFGERLADLVERFAILRADGYEEEPVTCAAEEALDVTEVLGPEEYGSNLVAVVKAEGFGFLSDIDHTGTADVPYLLLCLDEPVHRR